MSEQQRPHFLFVCDHGDREGDLDIVALLPWFPDVPGWWPAKGVHEAAIRIWPMEDDRRGWDPKWLRPEWTGPDEPDRRRFAIEIFCTKCSHWAYRSKGSFHTESQMNEICSLSTGFEPVRLVKIARIQPDSLERGRI